MIERTFFWLRMGFVHLWTLRCCDKYQTRNLFFLRHTANAGFFLPVALGRQVFIFIFFSLTRQKNLCHWSAAHKIQSTLTYPEPVYPENSLSRCKTLGPECTLLKSYVETLIYPEIRFPQPEVNFQTGNGFFLCVFPHLSGMPCDLCIQLRFRYPEIRYPEVIS